MANTMRWRYGDTNPVMLPVSSDTEIEIGDLIILSTSEAKPASSITDQGTLLLNQSALKSDFVGVAMQASLAGSTASIRVATSGVFEFDCGAATYAIGTLIGGTENAAGDQLLNQRVEEASSINGTLGRCAKDAADTPTTRLLVDIVSTVMKGGAQAL